MCNTPMRSFSREAWLARQTSRALTRKENVQGGQGRIHPNPTLEQRYYPKPFFHDRHAIARHGSAPGSITVPLGNRP